MKGKFALLLALIVGVGFVAMPAMAYDDEELPVEDTFELDGDEDLSQVLVTADEEGEDMTVIVEAEDGTELESETVDEVDELETIGVDLSDHAEEGEINVTVENVQPHSITPVYTAENYTVEVDDGETASEVFAEFNEMTDVAIAVDGIDEDGEATEVHEQSLEHVHLDEDDDLGAVEVGVDGEYDEYELHIEHYDDDPEETGYTTDSGVISSYDTDDVSGTGIATGVVLAALAFVGFKAFRSGE